MADPNPVIQAFRESQQSAQINATTSFEYDPDKAARAYQLEQQTGVPSPFIFNEGDIDEFENRRRSAAAIELVRSNPYIEEYLNSHPMAGKISSDGLGSLDNVSAKMDAYHGKGSSAPGAFVRSAAKGVLPMVGSLPAIGAGAEIGAGIGMVGGPLGSAAGGIIGGMIGGLGGSYALSLAQDYLLSKLPSSTLEAIGFDPEQARADIAEHGTASFLGGLAPFLLAMRPGTIPQGVLRDGATALERVLNKPIAQRLLSGTAMAGFEAGTELYQKGEVEPSHVAMAGAFGAVAAKSTQFGEAAMATGQKTATRLFPFLRSGKEPPVGLDPITDKLHTEEAKERMKALDDLFEAAQADPTKNRNADFFRNQYLKLFPDATIEIDAAAVRKLYGEKQPEEGDNLLGFVKDIAQQMDMAEASGGRISVPLNDWLAYADKDVAKELHDNIATKRGGMTLEEAKAPAREDRDIEPSGDSAVDAVRKAAGLEPLFAEVREKKLTLRPEDTSRLSDEEVALQAGRRFTLHDAEDKKVGSLSVLEDHIEKHLQVNWIGGRLPGEAEPNQFGLRAVLDLLGQIKEQFPDMETIGGARVSGARAEAGRAGEKMRIPLRTPTPKDLVEFAQTIPGWTVAESGAYPEGKLSLPPGTDYTETKFTTHKGEEATAIATFTARQAVDHIDTSDLRPLPKALYQFFGNRMKDLIGDVPIRVVTVEEMERIAGKPNQAGFYAVGTHEIVLPEDIATGVYGKGDTISTIMHEMGHAVTARAIKTDTRIARDVIKLMNEAAELGRLTGARQEFDYAFTKPVEFMAEAWSNPKFQEFLASLPMSPQLAERLGVKEKGGTIWDAVRNIVADLMEKLLGIRPDSSLLDGLMKINANIERKLMERPTLLEPGVEFMKGVKYQAEMAPPRRPLPPEQPTTKMKQMELPEAGTTRIEDTSPFKDSFIGMTAKRTREYVKAVMAKREDDTKQLTEKYMKDEVRTQSKEWKENEKAMRSEVADKVNNRPDLAADALLRYGRLGDISLPKAPRIHAASLSEEQIAALPKDWVVKRGGVPVDDIAGMFGYSSGDAMVEKLVGLHKGLKEQNIKRDTYVNRVIDQETEQHMQAVYGDKMENVISAAKDHVLSDVEENFLHQQTMALAEKAKLQYPIKKEDLKQAVVEDMQGTTMKRISSDSFLADVGRAGKAMEDAFLKDDFAEAFRQSQAQQLAFLRAKEAAKYEKKLEKHQDQMPKFAKREITGVDPSFGNYIHLMMLKTGEGIKQSIQDLEKEISKSEHSTFNDFIDYWERKGGYDLHVPDFLREGTFNKPVEEMTGAEFSEVYSAFTAMAHAGRDRLTLYKDREKVALNEVLDEMVQKIKSVGPAIKHVIHKDKSKVMEQVKSYWWSGINIETMLNRIDRNDPHGIMFRTIVDDYTKSSNSKEAMMKEYQEKLSAISVIPDMNKKVDNNLFVDRHTKEYFQMSRRNVLGILQNWGNASNRRKMAEGYGLKPDDIEAWLLKNTTKEDWERAQKIGDLFKELFEKADDMSRHISGVGIEGLELNPFTNAHGSFEGWYNPVKYDPIRPGSSKKLLGPGVDMDQEYFRATTPQGYTKGRTGYIAPMELNLDIIPIRMRQMIHDINIRPTIIQLSKVFYDPKFKSAMIGHYGEHQANMFLPFLNDLANSSNFKSHSEYLGSTALEYFRQNIIATLIGFNPSTVLKHGPTAAFNSLTEVGPINFMREFMSLTARDDATGMTNWSMAMDKSEQLQRRWRAHFTALIKGHDAELHLAQHSLRDFLIGAGATPVSVSDLLSAVPTWLAAYKGALAKGETEGFAVSLADRSVRRAHGDSALSNKPEIMRTNALGAWFSSLYGFFSHMLQRQYEMGWKAKDMLRDVYGKGSGDAEMSSRHAPDLLKGFMSYIIFPALVEELVTPYTNSEKDSWGMKAGKSLAMGLSSSLVGVRDATRALINVRDPQAGLIGTGYKAFTDVHRDITRKGPMNREQASNLIKHVPVLVGALTGLTNAQEGRTAEFMYRYSEGLEKPKGPWGALVGLRYGTIDKHSRTFDEWYKHQTGGH